MTALAKSSCLSGSALTDTLGAVTDCSVLRKHSDYFFANVRSTRIKLLVYDDFGVWCAVMGLKAGHFVWPVAISATPSLAITAAQFDALILGLVDGILGQVVVARLTKYGGPGRNATAVRRWRLYRLPLPQAAGLVACS